jgi:hypothetical protein
VRTWLAGALVALALMPAAAMAGSPFAPLGQHGPKLSVSRAKLRSSLQCEPSVRNAKAEPVLLNPATGVTPKQNYSWNWEPALDAIGVPWCAYTAPHHTLDDIQVSGEYLVHAIRTEHRLAGRRIAIIGHSQGGMSMRWPLRFWPGTRRMVADVVGFAGTNHGTTVASCSASNPCPAADWQQGAKTNFIRALNSRAETFKGISYTEVFTHTDEEVQPNDDATGTSSLHTGRGRITNIATQDICPADVYEHLMIGTIDPAAYALGVDAIQHPGPAKASRIPSTVCLQLFQPGVDPLSANTYLESLSGAISVTSPLPTPGVKDLPTEPKLRCYVFKHRRCPTGR